MTISHLWWGILAVTTAVTVIVLVVLCIAIARARAGRVAGADAAFRSDQRSRLVVGAAMAGSLVILLAILAADFVLGKGVLGERSPAGEPVRITVTGHQFWWQLDYDGASASDHLTTANELVVPTGTPIELSLRSTDVIHSFWLPALAGKKDLIPGNTNTLRFSVLRPGSYEGQCAEFCGYQHANMRTRLTALEPAEYRAWREQQAMPGRTPSNDAEQLGRQLFESRSCALCHAIQGTSASATTGPDLTHFGSRRSLAATPLPNTPRHLAAWIENPQRLKPGTNMPPTPLAPAELDALVAYLGSLR